MPELLFTARSVASLKWQEDGPSNIEYFDAKRDPAGFGLRVSKRRKVFFLSYRTPDGTKTRTNIERAERITLQDARKRAREMLAKVDKGTDPRTRHRRRRGQTGASAESYSEIQNIPPERRTLAEQFTLYLDLHAKKNVVTWREYETKMQRDVIPELGNRLLHQLTRQDVNKVIDRMVVDRGVGVGASRTLEVVKAFLNWSTRRGDVDVNVAAGIPKPAKTGKRDRTLTDDELRALWAAMDARAEACPAEIAVLRLMALSGQRQNEVKKALWRDVDLDGRLWTQPGRSTKSGKPNRLPLTVPMMNGFRWGEPGAPDDLIFPDPLNEGPLLPWRINELWRSITSAAGVKDFRPHDWRHVVATGMGNLKVPRASISMVLGHTMPGMTEGYNHAEYDDEKRQALEVWQRRLLAIVRGHDAGNVAGLV